jgi:hypothetical protein
MRVIDSQELLTALAHLSLRSKKILGRGFIRAQAIGSNIAEAVNTPSPFSINSAN